MKKTKKMVFKEVSTLQYMGSKSRILHEVCSLIMANKDIKTVVDLFAGTGTIGFALKPYHQIISNDLEKYSYVLNEGILNGCVLTQEEEEVFFMDVDENFKRVASHCEGAICKENLFLSNPINIASYKKFCSSTPSVLNPKTDDKAMEGIVSLAQNVKLGKCCKVDGVPILFVTYYANTYFGVAQCCEIDAIRDVISKVSDLRTQNVLLAALMTAMSNSASTTTHFAQYLKVNDDASCKNIFEKRKRSIIGETKKVLSLFRQKGILSQIKPTADCYNLDYVDLLNRIPINETTLVYADPPYFKEHYSRYYHILNTLCQYDYPQIALNPQTKQYSAGRYRVVRNVSPFGKKKMALMAFRNLIDVCGNSGTKLLISYSDNSIVAIQDILELMNEYYSVSIEKIQLRHSKQGRTQNTKVQEYLLMGKPLDKMPPKTNKRVEKVFSLLRDIKPLVDNPAGLMHNYMARKPYNIVSKIIEELCPLGGVVYDPMAGSGTVLLEASKLQRRAIGTDVNPLAYKISKVSLSEWKLQDLNSAIDNFLEKVEHKCGSLYCFNDGEKKLIIERCHFDQVGNSLVPTSYWYRENINGRLTARKKKEASRHFVETYLKLSKRKIKSVPSSSLIPNSRIAVGKNETVRQYFCLRNLIALDIVLSELKTCSNRYGFEVLELLVSSALNLIKLSDKKASSQMPFWLPKKDVTSRNALMILRKKKAKLLAGLAYLNENCKFKISENSTPKNPIVLCNHPAQNMPLRLLKRHSVDLVLTDPPYTDQVPYLEYGQLACAILKWDKELHSGLIDELVVSDAPSRCKDIDNFNDTFDLILKRTSYSVKSNGYFVLFYHSFDLKSWSNLFTLMRKYGFSYQGQIPIAAPRKSFKTVMSPKCTLDGNYVIVFRKNLAHSKLFQGTVDAAEILSRDCAKLLISSRKESTTQSLYDCGLLHDAVEKGYLSLLASKYSSFVDILNKYFVNSNGIWRTK